MYLLTNTEDKRTRTLISNMVKYCSSCSFFEHEDSFGDGWCSIANVASRCDNNCMINADNIVNKEIDRTLRRMIQELKNSGSKNVNISLCKTAVNKAVKLLYKQK